MIDAAEGAGVEEELVECPAVHAVRVGRDCGFLGEDDLPRNGWVDGEQAPIHEPAIAQVRIVYLLGSPLEYLVYKRLSRVRL